MTIRGDRMDNVAIIVPAKKHSRRLPNKNKLKIGDYRSPIFVYK